MGCVTSSTGPKAAPKSMKGKKKSSKGLDAIEQGDDISDQDLHRMKEQMLQRHDTEIDILTQLSAERTALRQMASGKIERKLSCEELLESLSAEEVRLLRESSHAHCVCLQRQLRHRLHKSLVAKQRKPWALYNNIEALDDTEISILGVFLINLLFALRQQRKQRLHDLPPEEREQALERERLKESAKPVPADLEQYIRALPVLAFSLEEHYLCCGAASRRTETNSNIAANGVLSCNEYELPPGLVTRHEVQAMISALRGGAKVEERSLQKLLRLGYAHLRSQRNVTRVTVKEDERLIVVGDIHGQLADLLHIIDDAGLPSACTKYIFNGDFVDRGESGCEVMSILLAMMAAFPESVFLNRGNHEDYAICSVYGFQVECYDKYDPLTFAMFVELFQHLPLFAVVNGTVLVVHGGLFHHADASIAELQEIDRPSFSLEDIGGIGIEEGEPVPRSNRERFLKQLARDALWSDPSDNPGAHRSMRGAGIAFGPDVTQAFLERNGLQYVIRSHECVRSGYEEAQEGLLCTIFSASDYGGSGNSAAYMEIHALSPEEEAQERERRSHAHAVFSSSAASARLSEKRERERALSVSEDAPLTALSQQDESNARSRESELRVFAATNLAYKVHYFFAAPLSLAANNEKGLVSSTTRDTLRAPEAEKEVQEEAQEEEDLFLSPEEVLSLVRSRSLGLQDTRQGRGEPRSRSVRLGSAVRLEELLWSRKALLLETLEEKARVWRESESEKDSPIGRLLGEGALKAENVSDKDAVLPLKDFARALQEIAKASFSWKKIVMLLLTDEDRVCVHKNSMDQGRESEREREKERASDKQRERQRERQLARQQEDREADVYVRFRVFLARYEDEVRSFVRRKEEEAARASMHQLHTYISSFRSTAQDSQGIALESLEVGLSHVNSNSERARETHFYGHKMRRDAVYALYLNAHQLENAFVALDSDGDGYFTQDDLERVCRDLHLVDPDSGALIHMPPHVKSNYFGPGCDSLDDGSSRFSDRECVIDAHIIFSLLDTWQCGEVDINAFFEAARLSLATHDAHLTSYTAREREWSMNAETRRLTQTSSTAALQAMLAGVSHSLSSLPGSPQSLAHAHTGLAHPHTPQRSALASVELRRGVEIAVDAELAPSLTQKERDEDSVGLDI